MTIALKLCRVAALAVSLAVTAGSAAAAASSPEDVTTIRFFSNHGAIAAFEIAAALGWLKEKNIRIQSVGYSESGPENLMGLSSGAIDVAGIATPPLINAISSGAKFVGVLPDIGTSKNINSKFLVLANSPIKTAADLKGKSIAVNTLGAHLDYTTREYLRTHGMHNGDVQLVVVPGPQLDQILRHKQTDVVAVGAWQTVFAGKIAAEGGARVLFTDYDVLGDIVLGNDAMMKAFIAKHPQAVRDFVTISARAADWAADHLDDARKVFAQILKARGDNPLLASYWPGYGLRRHALYTEHDAKFWIDVLVRDGRLKPGQFTPTDILTNDFNSFGQHLTENGR
jgi:ABC-type nitrate/sulfonate/bicarbonate transport system substrate-binding protein